MSTGEQEPPVAAAGELATPEPSRAAARLTPETRTAFRNASKLGVSLLATWGVATVVRLYLPRHLGPAEFGLYNFAESFAMTCFAFLSLGVEGYSLRELVDRPRHASDYFGGLVLLRTLLGALLVAVAYALLSETGPAGSASLVAVFGAGYLLFSTVNTLASFLQANATVDRLAVANVVAKVLWGVLMVAGIASGAPLSTLALVLAVSEGAKAVILYRESHRQLGLLFRVDWRATLRVLWAALPYFATAVALYLNRTDVAVLGFMAGNEEVGWYGAAGNFSLLVFLLYPLMPSVLLPTLRRVHARSEEELWRMLQLVTEGILVVCVPLALVVGLGAELWVRIVFGAEFANAAPSLRVLALQALFTYMASLSSLAMIVIGRRWTVTTISLFGVAAGPLVAFFMIPVLGRLVGPGGAGAGAALGAIATEAVVLGAQGFVLGARAFGRRSFSLIARCAGLGAAIVALHVLLAPLGPLRLLVDAAAYAAIGVPLGVLPLGRLLRLAREIAASRREA
jgi:O-antigen/teichoic acid export membrane protein